RHAVTAVAGSWVQPSRSGREDAERCVCIRWERWGSVLSEGVLGLGSRSRQNDSHLYGNVTLPGLDAVCDRPGRRSVAYSTCWRACSQGCRRRPFNDERGPTMGTSPDDMTPLDRLAASRRHFLSLAGLGTGAVALGACATGGGGDDGSDDGGGAVAEGGGEVSDDNPFGVDPSRPVDVVIFNGGYGDQYAKDAGAAMEALHEGITVN